MSDEPRQSGDAADKRPGPSSSGVRPQDEPPGGPPESPRPRLWRWMVQSKHVRAFFIVSVIVHVIVAIALSNRYVYDFLIKTEEGREVQVAPWEVRQAIQTLKKLYTRRFEESLFELTEIRAQLDALQLAKLRRMKAEDEDRREKVRLGVWPTAEDPDPQAEYFPRVDVEPTRFHFEPLADTSGMGLVELYRLHPPLEREIGAIYQRFHALELAESLEDPIPLGQALENTRLDLPQRRDVRAELLDTTRITSWLGEPFKQYKQELVDAWLETQDMLNTARRWLELAQAKDRGFLLSTMFGQQYDIVPPPVPYFGHYLNPKLLRQVDLQQLIDPEVALGNRIGEGEVTLGAQWVSIDRWYSVGPFHHPGATRRLSELERKYPPETPNSTPDLDAVYEGKGGRKLRWKYRHIGSDFIEGGVRFEPYTVDNEAYAIWYFYTEVWSDKDRTVLASFASDDYGVCWVNGQRLYQSPPDTQPWVPFTRYGFRAVPLRAGFNRFLFKLENATGTTGFSVILMTHEDRELIEAVKELE